MTWLIVRTGREVKHIYEYIRWNAGYIFRMTQLSVQRRIIQNLLGSAE